MILWRHGSVEYKRRGRLTVFLLSPVISVSALLHLCFDFNDAAVVSLECAIVFHEIFKLV